jgi:glucuronate isomerase
VGVQGEEMTKTPGEVEPFKQITKAEREARKAFREVEAGAAMTDHKKAQLAFHENRERLKAERLAREAAGTPVAANKAKPKKKVN